MGKGENAGNNFQKMTVAWEFMFHKHIFFMCGIDLSERIYHRRIAQIVIPLVFPFPNKPWFLHVCSTSLLKTLWEKKKLLVMWCSVFYPFGELFCNFHQI